MAYSTVPLAPSESKARFMDRLGLDLDDEDHKMIYRTMKSQAVAVYLSITAQRSSLLPRYQDDPMVSAPYTFAQISQSAMDRAMKVIYTAAETDVRLLYDAGRATDSHGRSNWVIRWLLWHVFRYRDARNRASKRTSLRSGRLAGRVGQEQHFDRQDSSEPTSSIDGSFTSLPYQDECSPRFDQRQQQFTPHESYARELSTIYRPLPFDPVRG